MVTTISERVAAFRAELQWEIVEVGEIAARAGPVTYPPYGAYHAVHRNPWDLEFGGDLCFQCEVMKKP